MTLDLLILIAGCSVFAIVTLPVEWDASRRAKIAMVNGQLLSEEENRYAGKVLNAAFLTYVAGAVSAIMVFIYYAMRAGLFSSDD